MMQSVDKVAKIYAKAILDGTKSSDGVPGVLRDAVDKWLLELADGKAGDADE